ncbi:MAG: MFS transporter [Candidatus Magasanikbacteria bacterium]|nr:MFS transporter [Candidatus Magasanikbacteria bacterium]
MGRYNFNVVKGDMGNMFHLDKAQMGIIATAGFWTYALSCMVNGPLADWLGGRRGMLIGAAGTVALNLLIGLLFLNGWCTKVLVGMSLLYAVNMYFQSWGALSVTKVNSSWFHVKERGILGGWFGSMISVGYSLAYTIGGWILSHFSWYWVFIFPSMVIGAMFIIECFLLRNRPSHAGYADMDVGDGTHHDKTPVNWGYLWGRMTSRVMLFLIAAEFCTGFVRQGLLLYYTEYMQEVHHIGKGTALFAWGGIGITLGGIIGALSCGWLSDKLFDSRRPPVACIFYACQVPALFLLGFAPGPTAAAFLVGFCCMFIFGIHGMLSGTASMDFGGRKATATATGMLDGVQYLASGLTGFGLGWVLKTYGWDGVPYVANYNPVNASVWVFCIIPFSIIGAILMTRIWNEMPREVTH